jgi:2-polyprenyl-3-methyl-5-hydroxy-6-metoxy-1,4-benzoquinol methylase
MVKKILTLIVFLSGLNFLVSYGQYATSKSDHISERQAALKKSMMDFFDFSPQDEIVDIGSGNGDNILLFASFYPNMHFTIEEIDSVACNAKVFAKNIAQNGYNLDVKNFKFRYGNENSTKLLSGRYSKVLMLEVLHEFTNKKEMLDDVKRILKKNGTIIISDILVYQKEKKSPGCNYPYLTENELKEILKDNHISISEEKKFGIITPNKYVVMFKCKPE